MRAVLGLIVGIVVGVLTVALVERIGGLIAPAPPGFTSLTPAELPAAIAALPLANKLSVVLAWFLGALGGAALAVGVSRRAWPGWVVAGLILALVLLTILAITHPLWMAIAGVAGPLLAGFIATRLARPEELSPAPAETV